MNMKNKSYIRISPKPGKPESWTNWWFENPSIQHAKILKDNGWNYSQSPHYCSYWSNNLELVTKTLESLNLIVPTIENLGYYIDHTDGFTQ